MPFYVESVGLKITQSKVPITVHRVKLCFSRKGKNRNYPVKSSVTGTQGTGQFSPEKVRPKIKQSKLVLAATGFDAFFHRKSKTKNRPVKITVNGTRVQWYFPVDK